MLHWYVASGWLAWLASLVDHEYLETVRGRELFQLGSLKCDAGHHKSKEYEDGSQLFVVGPCVSYGQAATLVFYPHADTKFRKLAEMLHWYVPSFRRRKIKGCGSFNMYGSEGPPSRGPGRPAKKQPGRSADDMKGVTESRETSRAQAVVAVELDAIVQPDASLARPPPRIAVIAVASNAIAQPDASLARPPARIRGLDDSSEDCFDDGRAPASSCPRGFALDESSDEAFFGGRADAGLGAPRRLRRRRTSFLERQVEESLAFQPDDVDPARCQALRSARVQCHSAKVVSTDYCRVHQRNRYNGVVRGALPAPVLAKFRDADARAARKNKPKKLYSRYHMWRLASKNYCSHCFARIHSRNKA